MYRLIAVLLILFSLSACKDDGLDKYVGTWVIPDKNISITIEKDSGSNSATLSITNPMFHNKPKVIAAKMADGLLVTVDGINTKSLTIKDNKLHYDKWTLVKK